jgi:hypothetical protein
MLLRTRLSFARRPLERPRRSWVPCVTDLEERKLLSAVDVLSRRDTGPTSGDSPNTGVNAFETTLSPTNVSANTFGKLATIPVDGQVYAQVLIKTGVNVTVGPEPGIRNVAFVATEHDSLYAIDADNGVVLWHDSFINPAAGITTVPSADTGVDNVQPEIGITSTPVINPATNLIYVMARTKQVEPDGAHYLFTIHALNLSNGAEALNGPTVVGDTIYKDLGTFSANPNFTYVSGPAVPGTGAGSTGGLVHFNAWTQDQRVSLTLAGNVVYAGFAYGGIGPYHGWLLGYNASTLQLVSVFNTTPNGEEGGIWQSGSAVTVDAQGNLYIVTGNGSFDLALNSAGFPKSGDYGDSVIKLAVDPNSSASHPNQNGWGLRVVDYFSPSNTEQLYKQDRDLGSGGLALLPDAVGSPAHRHLMIAEGKQGTIYLIDRDNMGKFSPVKDNVVQELSDGGNPEFNSPALLGTSLYYVAIKSPLQVYKVSGATIRQIPSSRTLSSFGYPGATPMISSNGGRNAIVWLLDVGTNTLQAYSAGNVQKLLYSSSQAPGGRDSVGQVVKFSVPTISNGRLYVGTGNSLEIFGLLPRSARIVRSRKK